MRQQVRHRQVCEVGQMGQIETESIRERGLQKSSRNYLSYVPRRALGADSNRSSETHRCGESSRNYLSYVSLEGTGTHGAHEIRSLRKDFSTKTSVSM